jgi:predicted AAA+ superfamily ATPase
MDNRKYIPRILEDQLKKAVQPGRVVVVYGPRQAGKTTLIGKYLESVKEHYLLYDGEDLQTQRQFTVQSIEKYKALLAGKSLLVIDEAQRIENIGTNLKLIVDHLPELKILVTGSSSFDLAKMVGEPLTGRKITYILYPVSQMELAVSEDLVKTRSRLEERLIYGSYPKVLITAGLQQKQNALKEIISSYLYKDILELEGIRYSRKISDLLTLLAFQIGKEVSLSELANNLNMSKNTVARYLDLLEKVFVIINIRGFSRNLRKEVTKMSRYYFYDVGIRNAIINNFNALALRNDTGMLWENYIVIERIKKQSYKKIYSNNYFWRTYTQQEIDLVEEREGKLFGYEIKWSQRGKAKKPLEFLSTYKQAQYKVIDKENYLDFIT